MLFGYRCEGLTAIQIKSQLGIAEPADTALSDLTWFVRQPFPQPAADDLQKHRLNRVTDDQPLGTDAGHEPAGLQAGRHFLRGLGFERSAARICRSGDRLDGILPGERLKLVPRTYAEFLIDQVEDAGSYYKQEMELAIPTECLCQVSQKPTLVHPARPGT